jgi:hypothetical protein
MLTEAQKDEIRWMCKTRAGGHPSWEEAARLDIEAAEKPLLAAAHTELQDRLTADKAELAADEADVADEKENVAALSAAASLNP